MASEHSDYYHWRRNRFQFASIRDLIPLYAAMTILSDSVKRVYPQGVAREMDPIANPVSAAGGTLTKPVGGAGTVRA